MKFGIIMRLSTGICLCAGVFAGAAEAAPPTLSPAIPVAFQGEWVTDREACGRAAEQSIRVAGRMVKQYAAVVRISSVQQLDAHELIVKGERSFPTDPNRLPSDPIQVWHVRERWVLSNSGHGLTVIDADGDGTVRYRCPPSRSRGRP
jgi:hypothetical protein